MTEQLIVNHLSTLALAVQNKSASGRGSSKKIDLYGIKKLRELILELAVRGKLVAQNPEDEPASKLLERIRAEKARLVREKKIPKQRPLPVIDDKEYPFQLPDGWIWAHFEDVADIQSGITKGRKLAGREVASVPYLRVANVQRGYLDLNEIKEVAIPVEELDKYRVIQRDLLITEGGDWDKVGRTAIWADELPYVAHQNHVFKARILLAEQSELWLERYLNGPVARQYFAKSSKQTTNLASINKTQLRGCLIAIPPAEEKERIVTKVDELMALCDQIEQQTEASLSAHTTLVENLLATLTNSANAEELKQNWQRIASHFTTLFTTEASIDQLKQTILQLAVMGKLVPQDPNDEPIQVLLDRIDTHEKSRIAAKEIKKSKKTMPPNEPPMDIQNGWSFLPLDRLAFITKLAGFEYTKHMNLKDDGEVPVIRAQNVRPFTPDTNNLKYIDSETSIYLQRSALDRPALLVTFIGAGIGDVCVFNNEKRWHLAPNVAKVEPFADISLQYLCIYLNSETGKSELFKSMKSTAQPSLSMTTIREIWIALPPLDEQHRIVTKVNQLTTLCDQIKTHLQHQQQTRLHLANAMVDQALNPTNPNSTTQTKAANP